MDVLKDEFQLPSEFPFRIFRTHGRDEAVPLLHWHDCLELNYVIGGSGVNVIRNTHYNMTPGEIYVINNREHHYAFSNGSLDLLVFIFEPVLIWQTNVFDYDYLKPFLERKVNFCNRIEVSNPLANIIGLLMKEIETEYNEKNTAYQLIIKALIMKILGLLNRHLTLEGQIGEEYFQKKRELERIENAIAYIRKNYTQNIKLQDIAQIAYMNPSYFSAYFKKVMNITLTDYILTLRVNHAAMLIMETSKSVLEISEESGFHSLSYFNRAFKKLTGLSPTVYKRRDNKIQK